VSVPISGATRLVAVIGSPVRHSLSPALHNAAFRAAGLDWRMVAFDVLAGGAVEAIEAMRTLGIAGYAVTMPHKAAVAAAVDQVDAAVAALGAVNTVVLRPDRSTLGSSTDGDGFVASVGQAGFELAGARVAVLGAGGAARSIIEALGRSGVDDIAVINRTGPNAELAASLAPVAHVGVVDDVACAALLINTTPIGMGDTATGGGELPIDPVLLRSDLVVADIVYHPLLTPLLRAAADAGAATIDGLGMLVHQAVLQQQLWTGQRPDPSVMRAAAESELAARSA
jgi:shikimate dehydrogenase